MKKFISILLFFLINQTIIPQSWVELNSPFNSGVRVLHVGNSNTLFAGGDNGFFSTNDSTWYSCTFGGINKTTNSGESWIPFGQSLPTSLVDDIVINKDAIPFL